MRIRSAASILFTLVYCTAENNVPRWSKPDRELGQGEWVPLNSGRLNQGADRLPGVTDAQYFNHAIRQNQPLSHFPANYQPKEIVGSQSAPPRVAFINSQGLASPTAFQQPQISQQQLLSQFLRPQLGPTNIPVFSRALLPKQQILDPNYYLQQENYNLDPNFNQAQSFKNAQYNVENNGDFEQAYLGSEKPIVNQVPAALGQTFDRNNFKGNFTVASPNKTEEVQILYVPVEMLREQERLRNSEKNIPLPDDDHFRNLQQDQGAQPFNSKVSKKFRHPIQPLKEQVPAHHLRGTIQQDKLPYLGVEAEENNSGTKNPFQRPSFAKQRATLPPRNDFYGRYNSEDDRSSPSGTKEQQIDESTIQDEISDQVTRNTVTRRTPQIDSKDRISSTLPPPNQPPLSVFMESTPNNQVGDVLSLLKDSKTIPVLDSVGPDAPQVFVGPSNLNTPSGYIKFELPYLSSLNNNINVPNDLSQIPFFVAPLNFHPPPGFAKIPFPPPHIGSVVLSNITNHQYHEEVRPTRPSIEHNTRNYMETFTIPADISSISPQLPSLINSLQEDEYLGASSTESLSEPTEEPAVKHRRPSNSRRPSHRGSQRAYASSTTTTRKPTSRQRRPVNRHFPQRVNSESKSNQATNEEQYRGNTNFNYNANNGYDALTTANYPAELIRNDNGNKDSEFSKPELQTPGRYFSRNFGNEKQEHKTVSNNQGQFVNYPSNYQSNVRDSSHFPNDGGSDVTYQEGRTHNTEPPNTELFSDTRTSEAQSQAINTTRNNIYDPIQQKVNFHYPTHQEVPAGSLGGRSQTTEDESAASLASYEEVQYRKSIKNDRENHPDNPNHKLNYRIQSHSAETYPNTEIPSSLRTYQEQTHQKTDEKLHYQSQNSQPTERQIENSYSGSFEVPNTSSIKDYLVSPDPNVGSAETNIHGPDKNYYENRPQGSNINDEDKNYEIKNEPYRRVTERPVPVRSRTRTRGRIQNQASHSQQTTPVASYSYEDENKKIGNFNRNAYDVTKTNSETYNERLPHQTESTQYTTTDSSPAQPTRKYLHSRGRRPSRPTLSTTASPSSTTTAAPGTKYLIRTRRPTAPHTRLQPGRGRIRRPTTPTTTATTVAISTTDYPPTLPFQWRQPVNTPEYVTRENIAYTPDTGELRGFSQNQEDRTSEVRYQNPLRGREENYQERRKYPRTKVEEPHKVPSYKAEEESPPTRTRYESTEPPQHFERTQKSFTSRDYDGSQKPHFVREYEKTAKLHSSREYETTPKTYLKDYEETAKNHYLKEYETTLQPGYSVEYDTTQKPYYSKEYQPQQKPLYQSDYDEQAKPQYNKYEGEQNIPDDSTKNSQRYNEFEESNKPQNGNGYVTTHKPQNFRNYETAVSQSYQDYETTQKPFVNHDVSNQKTSSVNSGRINNHSHRRRPSAVNRGHNKSIKYNNPESSSAKPLNSDFWNQAVTIQQSQSYVYNPDEDQPLSPEISNKQVNSKHTSLQNDYDDYYNVHEAEPSSDQSPFPSNDQHVTYTKAKPIQEVGKANQYAEKGSFSKSFVNQDELEVSPEKHVPQSENREQPIENPKETDKELNPSEESSLEYSNPELQEAQPNIGSKPYAEESPAPDALESQPDTQPQFNPVDSPPADSVEPQPNISDTHNKTGKRRGLWVRVRVKKPKDVFETAESQRFSSVRENSLLPDPFAAGLKEFNSSPKELKDVSQSESDTTTIVGKEMSPKSQSETDDGVKSEYTTSDDIYGLEPSDPTATTVTEPESQPDEGTTTYMSILDDGNTTTKPDGLEVLRTSTTTEISLETEICYKGQCIKTKRKKEDNPRFIPLVT